MHFLPRKEIKKKKVKKKKKDTEAENDNEEEQRTKKLHHHHHQSLHREGCWGTRDDFTTSFLSTALHAIHLANAAIFSKRWTPSLDNGQ